MNALDSLKAKVQEEYICEFDFTKYKIDDADKEIIIRNEVTIFRNYKLASEALNKVCKAIYENQVKFMHIEGSFMEWYTGIGFTKDKISELLKRNELYVNLEDKKEWVTSLSIPAVKMLTHKSVDISLVFEVAELGLTSTAEIEMFLNARKNEGKVIEISNKNKTDSILQTKNKCINYNGFEKLRKNIFNMSSEEVHRANEEIESLEKYLKDLKKIVRDRSKVFENKNNLKLVKVELDNK